MTKNLNIRIWSRRHEQELEDPYVVLNVNPNRTTQISFGDEEVYIAHGDFVVEIERVEDVDTKQ